MKKYLIILALLIATPVFAAILTVPQGGTGRGSFSPNSILVSSSTATGGFNASSSPTAGIYIATSTTATSTFSNGINALGGCFAISGTCIKSALSSFFDWIVNASNQLTPSSTPRDVLVTQNFNASSTGLFGDNVRSSFFTATSTTATSTFAGIVGIGTTTPAFNPLFTVGTTSTSSPFLFVNKLNGRVGMGTPNPGERLEVIGNIISKGTDWTIRTSAGDSSWKSVAYGNGLFVAINTDGASNRIMSSPDGINWTVRTTPAAIEWWSITYGNGIFVAVAQTGTGNRVMTSPDGITWTSRTNSVDNDWRGVAYGNGVFVAVADSGVGNRVMTSPDGITWTTRTSAADNSWYGVTYGNGTFVAVAIDGVGNRIMTSADGISWTSRTNPVDNAWYSVTYGNGLFVAVSTDGIGDGVMTSPTGVTWTSRSSASDEVWRSVTYGNGLFVAVADSANGLDGVMTSPDGIIWKTRLSAADNDWQSVTYGNGVFVAVAQSGTGNRVMTSGKLDYIPFSANNIYQGGMSIWGNVGVGTATPWTDFAVQGTSSALTLTANGTATNTASRGWDISAGCFSILGSCLNTGSGLTGSGSNGQVSFWTSATNLSASANFFWDNVNGFLGIATTVPKTTLHIAQLMNASHGQLRLESLVDDSTGLSFYSGVGGTGSRNWGIYTNVVTDGSFTIRSTTVGGGDLVGTGITRFIIDSSGRIGIGTTSPYAALSVVGSTGIVADKYHATNTSATSTFGFLTAGRLDSTGNATNTASQGFNVTTGCYAISGTCVGGGGVSGGTANMLAVWTSATVLAPSSTPTMDSLYATSTTATSTFAGFVGVGTTTPSDNALFVVGTSSGVVFIVDKYSGRVGIGTTTPTGVLSVNGKVFFQNLTGSPSGVSALCRDNRSEVTINAGSTSCVVSSIKYKYGVNDLNVGLAELLKFRPRSFYYKNDTSNSQYIGFIAEEVDLIEPRLVARNEKNEIQSVRYELLTALITKAVQELSAKLDLTNYKISEDGELVLKKVTADYINAKNELCIDTVCLNATQLKALKLLIK